MGKKPTDRDYKNVGLGINILIAKGIQDKQLKGGIVAKFAEGGLVDPDVLSAAETGGDISNWVAKTFQGEIESNAQKTLRMIRENAQKKGPQGGIPVKDGEGGEDDNFDFGPSGGPTTISGSNEQKWKAFYAMGAGAGAKYPELVAAQFALESGWGTALSGTHNYFGIKAAPGESSTTHSTKEEYNGKIVTINAGFKNFKNPQDAVNHLVNQWYKDYKGYKGVNRAADSYAAAQMLKDQSYATDSRYVRKLHDMLNRYGKIRGTPTDIGMVKTTGGGYSQAELAKSQAGPVGQIGDERMTGGGPNAQKIIAGAKKIIGDKRGVVDMCAVTTRQALAAGGLTALSKKRTQKGDLDTPKGTAFSGRRYAASFGGSDMGQVIRNRKNIKAGDIVLWRQYSAGGKYNAGAITHVGIAADDGLKNQYDHSKKRGFQYRPHWDKDSGTEWFAGVRLMDNGGMINGLTPAILGEAGRPEGVVGGKITQLLEEMSPGTLPAIIGSRNKSDLRNTLENIIPVEDIIIIPSPSAPEDDDYGSDGGGGGGVLIASGGGRPDPYSTLYQGG
jgi:hypothetical protein